MEGRISASRGAIPLPAPSNKEGLNMNDVTERLRKAASEQSGHEWPELNEAADELERLRRKLKRINQITMKADMPDTEKVNFIIYVLAND